MSALFQGLFEDNYSELQQHLKTALIKVGCEICSCVQEVIQCAHICAV